MWSSTSSAPSGSPSWAATASRSRMTRCCRPGSSSGTAGAPSPATGPVQPGHHRCRALAGQQRPALAPPVPPRAARHHRRCRQPLAGRTSPLPSADGHKRRRSSTAAYHAARRSTRRRRSAVAILALLTVLAVAASGFAFSQRASAVRQRDQASYSQPVAEALQLGANDTPPLAAQLNLAANRIQQTQDLASRLVNTENTPLPAPLAAGAGFVYSVAYSRDGHVMASGNSDGTIRLWNVADPVHPRPLGQPLPSPPVTSSVGGTAIVQSVTFSRDGRTLASGDNEGTYPAMGCRRSSAPPPARPGRDLRRRRPSNR